VGVIIGLALAYAALGAPSGYAAAYSFGGAWLVATAGALVFLVTVPFRRTRRISYAAVACGASLLIIYYAAFLGGRGAGLYDWWGDEKIAIPPTEPK
jgi:hypothetical protein